MASKMKKTIIIAAALIACSFLAAFFSVRTVNNKRQDKNLDFFQTEVRSHLIEADRQIEGILSVDDKQDIEALARTYDRLATTIYVFSHVLADGSIDYLSWRDFASYLRGGWRDPQVRDLFQNNQGSLSKEEKEFLESLHALNLGLLSKISSDSEFMHNEKMNTEQIKELIRQAGLDLRATFFIVPPLV